MPPPALKKQASLYGKLALKDMLAIHKKRQALALLQQDLEKYQSAKTDLTALLEQDRPPASHTSYSLRSASWYDTQLRDQLAHVTKICHQLRAEYVRQQMELKRLQHGQKRKKTRGQELTSLARRQHYDRDEMPPSRARASQSHPSSHSS